MLPNMGLIKEDGVAGQMKRVCFKVTYLVRELGGQGSEVNFSKTLIRERASFVRDYFLFSCH